VANDDYLVQRYEEVVAALAHLRRTNAKLRAKAKELKAQNAGLLETVADLAEDNERLRERLKAKRQKYPDGVMTFGKFQGYPVKDVPTWYLEWCLRTCFTKAELRRKQSQRLKEAIEQELERREAEDHDAPLRAQTGPGG
jgi:uncharacterized protein (DUF3820 family)